MNASFYAFLLTYLIQQSFQAKPSGYGIDDVRPFTIRVTRLECIETPYKLITLKACNVKLRRNEPTRINLEKFMPNTMPAGDYRIDLRVTDKNNVTVINARGYLSIRSKGLAALSMLDW
ncbi:hypothetical protein quinque_009249 [Culex quinquefasciatus]